MVALSLPCATSSLVTVRRPRRVLRVIGVLPRLRESIKQDWPMVPYPVVPARCDARVRGQDLLQGAARARPIGLQPLDGPPRYDLHCGTSFVEQRGELDG